MSHFCGIGDEADQAIGKQAQCVSLPVRSIVRSRLTTVAANVFLPKDRISMAHQGFGFCEFLAEDDAEYACKIMNQIKLYGKPIRVNKASYDKKTLDVGANLFIGTLDEMVDENALYDTFSTFGAIAEQPKVSIQLHAVLIVS